MPEALEVAMPALTRIQSARAIVVLVPAIALAVAGCANDTGSTTDGGGAASGDGGGATTVDVTVQEFSVNPSTESAPAGEVTFVVTNDGPDDVHEFVVIATDLDPAELPTDENGAVDEEGEGIEVIDEIEDIPVGETQEVTVDLDAGNYVLICNIFDEDEQEAHYEMGMQTAFQVTE
jgi:uncharacterized cupredoxin-like copper-binding protein